MGSLVRSPLDKDVVAGSSTWRSDVFAAGCATGDSPNPSTAPAQTLHPCGRLFPGSRPSLPSPGFSESSTVCSEAQPGGPPGRAESRSPRTAPWLQGRPWPLLQTCRTAARPAQGLTDRTSDPSPCAVGTQAVRTRLRQNGRPGARRRLKLDPKKEMVFLPLKFGSLGMKAKMIVIINFVS